MIPRPPYIPWKYMPDTSVWQGQPMNIPNNSEYKARLEIGDLFFRAKNVGFDGNDIWVEFLMVSTTLRLNVGKGATILETYDIPAGSYKTGQVQVAGNNLDIASGKVTAQTPDPIIGNRLRARTSGVTVVVPHYVFGNFLRNLVNASSNLIEMPARGTDQVDALGYHTRTARTVGRNTPYFGAEPPAQAFKRTNLFGGAGLHVSPSQPTQINAGPLLTLQFMRWSEAETTDGSVKEYNCYLAWAGDDATTGQWVPYDDKYGGQAPRGEDWGSIPWAEVVARFPYYPHTKIGVSSAPLHAETKTIYPYWV